MSHIGIAIDQTSGDIFLAEDGNLSMAEGAEAVGQHVRQRLGFFQGEWFLDTTAGMPWLDDILGRRYNPALAEAVVKAEITATHGVTEITSFSVSFARRTRGLIIRDVEVLTTYDETVRI